MLIEQVDLDGRQFRAHYRVDGSVCDVAFDVQRPGIATNCVSQDVLESRRRADLAFLKSPSLSIDIDPGVPHDAIPYDDRGIDHMSAMLNWMLQKKPCTVKENAARADVIVNANVLATIMETLYSPMNSWTLRAYRDIELTPRHDAALLVALPNDDDRPQQPSLEDYENWQFAQRISHSILDEVPSDFDWDWKIYRHVRSTLHIEGDEPIEMLVNGEVDVHTTKGRPFSTYVMTCDLRRHLSSGNQYFWEMDCRKLWNRVHWAGMDGVLVGLRQSNNHPITQVTATEQSKFWENRCRWPGGAKLAHKALFIVGRVLAAVRRGLRSRIDTSYWSRRDFCIKVSYDALKPGVIDVTYEDDIPNFWYVYERWYLQVYENLNASGDEADAPETHSTQIKEMDKNGNYVGCRNRKRKREVPQGEVKFIKLATCLDFELTRKVDKLANQPGFVPDVGCTVEVKAEEEEDIDDVKYSDTNQFADVGPYLHLHMYPDLFAFEEVVLGADTSDDDFVGRVSSVGRREDLQWGNASFFDTAAKKEKDDDGFGRDDDVGLGKISIVKDEMLMIQEENQEVGVDVISSPAFETSESPAAGLPYSVRRKQGRPPKRRQ